MKQRKPASLKIAIAIWIAGFFTVVPGGLYYLFMHAERDEYAFFIVLPVFWLLGYWGVVGPLLAALKARAVLRLIEQVKSEGELREALHSQATRDTVIDMIATDNHIPRWLAERLLNIVLRRLTELHTGQQAKTQNKQR